MSYTFSRRSFLKYTAVAAVAVAGSALLAGCEVQDPYNPSSKAPGTSLTINQVTAKLKDEKNGTSLKDGRFALDIQSSYGNTIQLTGNNFQLIITGSDGKQKYSCLGGALTCTGGPGVLAKGDKASVTVTVPSTPAYPALKNGDVLSFRYIPVLDNASYTMIWTITVTEDSASSETTGE